MKHSKLGRYISHVCLVATLFIVASCHSAKSTIDEPTSPYQTKKTTDYSYLERRLSIIVDRHDDLKLLNEAARWMGTPYKYGGLSSRGMDCSGLTTVIYNNVYGIRLHRRSTDQYRYDCKPIAKNQLRQGDLVFFATGKTPGQVSHVGVFLKQGKFIHATTSRGVVISGLNENYWVRTYVGAGRVKK